MKDFEKLNELLKDSLSKDTNGLYSIYHPVYDFYIDDTSSYSIDEINELFQNKKVQFEKIKKIHTDLQKFIKTDDNGITSIHHIEFEVNDISKYSPDDINYLYIKNKEILDEFKLKGEYENYIMSVPINSRIKCFVNYLTKYNNVRVIKNLPNKLNGRKYWEFLRFLWIGNYTELFFDRDIWWKLLRSKNSGREYFMSEIEREKFISFPNQLKIFRGYVGRIYTVEINSKNKFSRSIGPDETIQGIGYSYTLSKEIGMEYFNKYQKYNTDKEQNMLFEGIIDKQDILGFIDEKSEKEIVIIPSFLSDYGNPY